MAKKLEKKCRVYDLILGHRYSLTQTPSSEFSFVVIGISEDYVKFQYLDKRKSIGIANFSGDFDNIYEFPFTSLELELL